MKRQTAFRRENRKSGRQYTTDVYTHKGDTNDAPLDPNFQGYGVIKTDSQGRYRFKTIKPCAYPTGPSTQRTPHIHFDIAGSTDRLVSQMFFPNEPLNEKDGIFMNLHEDSAKTTDAVTTNIAADQRDRKTRYFLTGTSS